MGERLGSDDKRSAHIADSRRMRAGAGCASGRTQIFQFGASGPANRAVGCCCAAATSRPPGPGGAGRPRAGDHQPAGRPAAGQSLGRARPLGHPRGSPDPCRRQHPNLADRTARWQPGQPAAPPFSSASGVAGGWPPGCAAGALCPFPDSADPLAAGICQRGRGGQGQGKSTRDRLAGFELRLNPQDRLGPSCGIGTNDCAGRASRSRRSKPQVSR